MLVCVVKKTKKVTTYKVFMLDASTLKRGGKRKSRTRSLKEHSHTVILKVAHIPIAKFFFIAENFINRLLF